MRTNDTQTNGVPVIGGSLEEEYMLFDQLPRELRDLLNYCPEKATASTLFYPTFFGTRLRPGILKQWCEEFRAAYPDYEPMKSDDFPIKEPEPHA
jgi:hypothetical protein